ncbi:MAG: class I SAM-dependent methyltransferase [Deltaproteobacteria bacterium]|nr:class I SAM-dependent methyltransferase [Deltaproteobacteria bacterium]
MDDPVLKSAEDLEQAAVYLRPDPAADILFDACCGDGTVSAFFAPKVKMVVACDTSMPLLKQAQELISERQALTNVSFREADPEELPFPAGAFSLLCSRRDFQGFSDLDRVLAEFYRVLRWEGRMAFIDTLLPDDPAAAAFFQELNRLRDGGYGRAFTLGEWRQALASSPFRIDVSLTFQTTVSFPNWCRSALLPAATSARLRELWLGAPAGIADHFQLKTFAGEVESFVVRRILVFAFHPPKPSR